MKSLKLSTLAFVLALTLGGSAAAQLQVRPVPTTRTALVMGVWDYKDPTFPALPKQGIQSDLAHMKEKLAGLGFQVTLVENPTLKQAKDAVDAFGATLRSRGGASLFYFTGHGAEHEGKNFLIPAGTDIEVNGDLDDEALSANRVLERMESSEVKVNLIFLDCCRNALTKAGGDSGLAPMTAKGALIGFATRAGDLADASDAGSPYTDALVKHLGQPGISLTDMHSLVTEELERSGSKRRPGQYADLGGIYHLVPASPFAPLPGLVPTLPVTPLPGLMPTPGAEPNPPNSFAISPSTPNLPAPGLPRFQQQQDKDAAAKAALEATARLFGLPPNSPLMAPPPGSPLTVNPYEPQVSPNNLPMDDSERLVGVPHTQPGSLATRMAAGDSKKQAAKGAATPAAATKELPFINGLGMKYVPVLSYQSGRKVLFSVWETRRQDYAAYASANAGVDSEWKTPASKGIPFDQGDDHPVVKVSWYEATGFCVWLTLTERLAGRLGAKDSYRLPTDMEWSYAVGIGANEDPAASIESKDGALKGTFPWGTAYPPPVGAGNYADATAQETGVTTSGNEGYRDGYATTAPVGSFEPNDLGLHDLGGNVWEWCQDPADAQGKRLVARGAAWNDGGRPGVYSSVRDSGAPGSRTFDFGFRVVLELGAGG